MPTFRADSRDFYKKEYKKLLTIKRNFISYAQGAKMFSMNYYSFVKLAKEAGANIRIKKKVVIDLELVEKYLENNN